MNPEILQLHAAIEEEHWWFTARRQIIADVLRALEFASPSPLIVDLGCGTGGNLAFLSQWYRCLGVEVDAQAVGFAIKAHPQCRFVQGSVFETQTWELEEPADACLLMDVLEHLEHDREAVESAVGALRNGGYLLVTVPADPRLWGRHDLHHHHFRRYTGETLRRLLRHEDLEPVLMSGLNSRLYPLIRIARWMQGLLSDDASGRTGDLSMPPTLINRILHWTFSGESPRIVRSLHQPERAYRVGVSLLALYRRRTT